MINNKYKWHWVEKKIYSFPDWIYFFNLILSGLICVVIGVNNVILLEKMPFITGIVFGGEAVCFFLAWLDLITFKKEHVKTVRYSVKEEI